MRLRPVSWFCLHLWIHVLSLIAQSEVALRMGYSCSYRCGKLRIDELYVVPGCYDCHFFVTRSVGCSAWPGAISNVAEGCRRPLCGAVVTALVLLLDEHFTPSHQSEFFLFSEFGIACCPIQLH